MSLRTRMVKTQQEWEADGMPKMQNDKMEQTENQMKPRQFIFGPNRKRVIISEVGISN